MELVEALFAIALRELLRVWIPIVIAVVGWVITALLAVLGWSVSHRYMIRAQDKNLRNQLMNDARLELTNTLRNYVDWLGRVHSRVNLTLMSEWNQTRSSYGR